MTPPIDEVITPTGHRVGPRRVISIPKPQATDYLVQLDGIRDAAAKSAASRLAFLTAPYSETK